MGLVVIGCLFLIIRLVPVIIEMFRGGSTLSDKAVMIGIMLFLIGFVSWYFIFFNHTP